MSNIHHHVCVQMRDQLEEAVMRFLFQAGERSMPYLVLSVHRDTILEDTLRLVQGKNGDEFKKPLKVHTHTCRILPLISPAVS